MKSVANVEVTRDETIEIPGGKEHFIEWTARDEAGTTETIRAHHVRTDTPVSYTMSTNMVSKITAADGSTSSHTKNISVSAIKGEEADGVRHDHVTLTVIAPDGESHRQTLEVPVRLDFPEFQGLSTAEIIKTFGTKVIRKEGL